MGTFYIKGVEVSSNTTLFDAKDKAFSSEAQQQAGNILLESSAAWLDGQQIKEDKV